MKQIKTFSLFYTFIIVFAFLILGISSLVKADTIPDAPGNFTATPQSNYIELNWIYDGGTFDDNICIYRATSQNGTYTLLTNTYSYYNNSFYDYDAVPGVTYYYKIQVYNSETELYSESVVSNPVAIPLSPITITSIASYKSQSLTITWNSIYDVSGYYIYRSTSSNGTYSLVGNITENYLYTNTFTDNKLTIGQKYYYKICGYVSYNGQFFKGEFSNTVNALVKLNVVKISKSSSKKKAINTITWKKNSYAQSYKVYYSTKYNGTYKKLATLKSNKLSYTHKKLKNGKAYYYKVYAYRKINGVNVGSFEPTVYEKYCDYYTYSNESYESKFKRIFGSAKTRRYKSLKVAKKHMTEIKVKVWNLSGKRKYKKTYYLTVNKKLAPSIKKMFSEIYKSKERFPIKDLGCFSWRSSKTSEHCIGTAFDFNSNENYMIDNGKILAGSFWKPKKSKYSIPLNCKLVKILDKYGFYRGFWGNRKDYMHFSYFGT